MDKLLTRKELGEALSYTYQTIRRMESKGMPVIRNGKSQPRYDYQEVIDWMRKNTKENK